MAASWLGIDFRADPRTPLGLVAHTGLDYGLLTNIIGAVVLLLWIPIRQRPGVGTVLNVLLIGPSASLGLRLIPQQLIAWRGLLRPGPPALAKLRQA